MELWMALKELAETKYQEPQKRNLNDQVIKVGETVRYKTNDVKEAVDSIGHVALHFKTSETGSQLQVDSLVIRSQVANKRRSFRFCFGRINAHVHIYCT
jgi:hypothetical protein